MRNENNEQNGFADVHDIFTRVSDKYDFMNRLMTFGKDSSWRRFLVSKAGLPMGGMILDAGIGTGGIAIEALRKDPTLHIAGIDLTMEMMRAGMKRPGMERVGWCRADALRLPFSDGIFDAVVSGFLIRNVANRLLAFSEQVRVIRPGGRVVCLDTTPVPRNILTPFILFYLKVWIPCLGRLITGEKDAYHYLSGSTMSFMGPDKLAGLMKEAGLINVGFKRFMFGTIAVHWGEKPVLNDIRDSF
ncbi:MAG: ubiquinone/menaquinone biosynthesis methyltransferase [Deltaproteobacteria bacterium]|nr:ubiquinone/menaquinone biosynthesis methyltransferase [Deltaproteobacteria bacterium]